MTKLLRKSALATLLVALTLGAAAPAEARHRNNDDAAIAIGAGVIGLALGAAIAFRSARPVLRRRLLLRQTATTTGDTIIPVSGIITGMTTIRATITATTADGATIATSATGAATTAAGTGAGTAIAGGWGGHGRHGW